MSFFRDIRDALFGTTPEVKQPEPAKPAPEPQPVAPSKPAVVPQTPVYNLDVTAKAEKQAKAGQQGAARNVSQASSTQARRGDGSPLDELHAAATSPDLAHLTRGDVTDASVSAANVPEPKSDVTGSEFIKLAEAQIKALQAEKQSIDALLVDHGKKVAEVGAAYQQSLDALIGELLPNLSQATWDRVVKLTGFAMKNAPIGDTSPAALARVQQELALFIKHSDRAEIGKLIQVDARALQIFKRVDGMAAKVAYMQEIAERYGKAKAEIDKQILELGKQIIAAKSRPSERIPREQASERLGNQRNRRREEEVRQCRGAYERVYVYTRYESCPSFFETWFWWHVFTGGFHDRYVCPREVEVYVREHPEYKPPVPNQGEPGNNQPRPGTEPPPPDPNVPRRES